MNQTRLEFVFPNIHFDADWDVSNGRSLWTLFIANNIVESPLRIGAQSNYIPGIAESWVYSDDKKTLKLKISSNYKFHDGTSITPIDVAESIKRLIVTQKAAHSDLFDSICSDSTCEGVKAEDGQVTIRLNRPVNGLTYSLSSPEFGIIPPAYYKGQVVTHERLKNLSGPYKVDSFTKERMDLSSFSGHPLLSPTSVQKVSIIEIKDFADSINYYNSHSNVVLVGSDYSSAAELDKLEGKKYVSAPALTEFIVSNIDSPKLNSVKKRKDIFSLLQNLKSKFSFNNNIADHADQIFVTNSVARVDREAVSKLYEVPKNSNKEQYTMLLFDWMKKSPLPYQLRDMLAKQNIDLNIKVVSIPEGLDLIGKKEYDFVYIYSGVSALDPIAELVYLFKHPITQFNYKNQENAQLLESAKVETNHQKYLETIKKIHFNLLADYRILPLLHTRMIYLAKGDYKMKELNHFDGGFNLWDWVQANQ
ncbi:MAG: hypothetical protein JSU04_06190 [Bdellovibrionales bacterium]|nr:hypothetical protein [Bdellovibrionales bacterium]